ncbi:helix-turn-helix transcriptional regulator [Cytobacillus firmus]|uniref:helix-turn-helix transcriptional regulator n=1 Tax=Cytobacillus firmus TaxID=1399 RepID=UPI0018CF3304|nr:helix-turn-helix transcriptional regulator [Cytobacillus firmus]MBG9548322.1 XRE family transcriptional regulator [Cytobacillus firmus]MBG9600828.1 XRE family transcriptional regulator [Cytobacillus firmus]MBG9657848.1 XRE family transcriptional regulator [Cytobacillus firmus]MED1904857.1 helix-turn-helix transcriptional regulator [Cytobacillus firmus]MED1938907.1 helix-turn-helix transcriptional regulator [Cytobacillus firmus]
MTEVEESAVVRKRKELKLTQEELAKKLNISRQYYNAIENLKRTPSVDLAKELAKILDLEWTIFFN